MNRKENYKDLDKWRRTKNRQRRRYYDKTKNVEGRYKRWSDKEIKMVMEHEVSDTELSALIGHSVGAIQARRYRENKKAKE